MIKPSKTKEDIDPAYMRVISRITDGLDNASCIAVMMGLDRKTFLRAARMSFDFIDRWHDTAQKEQEGSK